MNPNESIEPMKGNSLHNVDYIVTRWQIETNQKTIWGSAIAI